MDDCGISSNGSSSPNSRHHELGPTINVEGFSYVPAGTINRPGKIVGFRSSIATG